MTRRAAPLRRTFEWMSLALRPGHKLRSWYDPRLPRTEVVVFSKLRAFLLMAACAGALTVALPATAQGDVDARESDGSTPLQWAVYQRDAAEVQRLLEAGADVSLANNYGATPMSLAAATGDAKIIRLLLKAGADPDSANAEGQTALMAVARTGNVEAAKLLVRAGAKVNAREQWGNQTALMWAAAQRQPEMVKFLVRSRAEV